MSTQSYPWYKFAHVEYLLNPVITGLSLSAQGANTRLMAYAARELPFGTLPNNEKDLITMSGAKSVKEYQKILSELMDRVWFVGDDRLFCPLMNIESAPIAQESKQDSEDDKKGMTNAERQAAYRARLKAEEEALRNAQENNEVTDSNVTHNNEVTERNDSVTGSNVTSNVTSNAAVTDSNVTQRNEMGDKGEDLDLDLNQDLDLDSKKSNTTPNNLAVIAPPSTIDPVLPVQSEPVQEPTKKPSRKRINIEVLTENDLVNNYGASPRYAKDWLAFRAKKNAPLTPSSMESLISQAELAGITVAQAIEVCAKKPWQGFNATWNYSDIISVKKTANDATRLKGIKALVDSGQSQTAAETFIKGMIDIYGLDLVSESIISVIANTPHDVTEYIGNFLRSNTRNKQPVKPVFGNVNSKFSVPTVTKLTEAEIQENKEAIHDLPF